jgi:hypothetical protein
VTIGAKLVHSKMTRGQGKCKDSAEVQGVIDAVNEHLGL